MGFLGTFGSIARGIGSAGEQIGAASGELRKDKLQELMDAIRLQQIKLQIQKQQQEMQQFGQPQPYGIISGPTGSQEGVTFDPKKGTYSHQTILPGYDAAALGKQSDELINSLPEIIRPVARGVYDSYAAMGKPEEGFKAVTTLAGRGITAQGFTPKVNLENGIPASITRLDENGQKVIVTPKSPEWTPQDQQLFDEYTKKHAQYLTEQEKLAGAKGAGYGAGRAQYMISSYIDENGNLVPMSAMDAIKAIHSGRQLTPAGRLPAPMAIATQRLVAEATPAIAAVRANVNAYDNSKDRAIFARLMEGRAAAAPGEENAWLTNVLNQAFTSNLSPEGKRLVIRLRRLNDTLGTLRATLGLPATESMMALTLSLVPGPTTPNSEFANDQLDQLEQIVTNAVQIPVLEQVVPQGGGPAVSKKTSAKSAKDEADEYWKSLNAPVPTGTKP